MISAVLKAAWLRICEGWRTPFLLVLCGAACTACATTGGTQPVMVAGAPVAAPPGLFHFCVRNPAECDIGEAAQAGAMAEDIHTAGQGAAASAAVLREVPVEAAANLAEQPGAALAMVRVVNTFVNHAITYRSDMEIWGVEDYWTLPLTKHGVAYGDCEDYALEKRAMLIAAGVSRRDVRLALVWSAATGHHAVLLVNVAGERYVLDNADQEVRRMIDTPYTWLAVQNDDNLLAWASFEPACCHEPQTPESSDIDPPAYLIAALP